MTVENIKIGGETYPIKFGGQAIERIMNKVGFKGFLGIGQLLQDLPIDKMAYAIKCGIDNGYLALDEKKKTPDIEAIQKALDLDYKPAMKAFQVLTRDLTPEIEGAPADQEESEETKNGQLEKKSLPTVK